MREEPLPTYHRFSCPCGANVRVKIDPAVSERHVMCPRCEMRLDFIVSMDSRYKGPRVSIVVPPTAVKTQGESLGRAVSKADEVFEPDSPKAEEAPPEVPVVPRQTRVTKKSSGRTIRAAMGTCICGASFPVDEEELTSVQACPECKVSYHVVIKLEPGTRKKNVILVPVKVAGQRSMVGSMPPPPAEVPGPSKKGRTRVTSKQARTSSSARSKAPPELPPGAQAVTCSCGEVLVVRRRDVTRGMECTGCKRSLKFQEVRDPQTLAPIVRIRSD